VGDEDPVEDALAPGVYTLTRQKSLQDRTQNCLYETWVGDGNDGGKENTRETMLTASGIRFLNVPIVFVLGCVMTSGLRCRRRKT
jgi:hypothetical protein